MSNELESLSPQPNLENDEFVSICRSDLRKMEKAIEYLTKHRKYLLNKVRELEQECIKYSKEVNKK